MANSDLVCIINSGEAQLELNPSQCNNKKYLHKKNPLVSIKTLAKLYTYDSWCEKIGVHWS